MPTSASLNYSAITTNMNTGGIPSAVTAAGVVPSAVTAGGVVPSAVIAGGVVPPGVQQQPSFVPLLSPISSTGSSSSPLNLTTIG